MWKEMHGETDPGCHVRSTGLLHSIPHAKKLKPNAILPCRATEGAAGYDIASSEDMTIPKHDRRLVNTELAIALPRGTCGKLMSRSGLASKHKIDVGAGIIDWDYRGQVKVLLINHGEEDFNVKIGDRIAQLIVHQVLHQDFHEAIELDDTKRGEGGFGSTLIASSALEQKHLQSIIEDEQEEDEDEEEEKDADGNEAEKEKFSWGRVYNSVALTVLIFLVLMLVYILKFCDETACMPLFLH